MNIGMGYTEFKLKGLRMEPLDGRYIIMVEY